MCDEIMDSSKILHRRRYAFGEVINKEITQTTYFCGSDSCDQ